MSGIAALLVLAVALLALSAWSCWREGRRADRYQQWMIEESIRADKAESLAVWRLRLTDAEREAVERTWDTLRCLQADYGKTQTEQDAATLRGLLERLK